MRKPITAEVYDVRPVARNLAIVNSLYTLRLDRRGSAVIVNVHNDTVELGFLIDYFKED